MFEFAAGIVIMFGALGAVGITRGRWLSQTPWVVTWFSLSAILAIATISDFLLRGTPSELFYGLSVGYVLGVTLHTFRHSIEELRRKPSATNEGR